jgi:hypothetical protein
LDLRDRTEQKGRENYDIKKVVHDVNLHKILLEWSKHGQIGRACSICGQGINIVVGKPEEKSSLMKPNHRR